MNDHWMIFDSLRKNITFHKKKGTLCNRNEILSVVRNPLGLAVDNHVLRDLKGFDLLKNPHELRLSGFDGSVDIGTFDIESGLIVLIVVEKFAPVLLIQLLSKNVVHLFTICCQLSIRILSISILCRAIICMGVNWVARSMPE